MVILFGGFLLVPQDATFWQAAGQVALKVMIPASFGMTIGSLFPYYVAKIGEKVAVDRFGKLLQVDWALVEKAEAYFKKTRSDELLLFVVRAVPIIPSVIIGVFCGLVRMPVGTFLLWSFLGNLIRTFILGLVGWAVGAAYEAYAHQISSIEDIVLYGTALVVLLVIAWFVRRQLRSRSKNKR
jgi:membrane protein DedA with SNARE-associated domain